MCLWLFSERQRERTDKKILGELRANTRVERLRSIILVVECKENEDTLRSPKPIFSATIKKNRAYESKETIQYACRKHRRILANFRKWSTNASSASNQPISFSFFVDPLSRASGL